MLAPGLGCWWILRVPYTAEGSADYSLTSLPWQANLSGCHTPLRGYERLDWRLQADSSGVALNRLERFGHLMSKGLQVEQVFFGQVF